MVRRNERVQIVLTDHFTGRIAAAAEAARIFGNEMALQQATWEPHDWSDFT